MTEPRKRSYKMGHRQNKDFSKARGQLSRNRWGWVKVYFGQFVIFADYELDDEKNETDEVADIKLLYPIPNRPPVTWNLTACTEEELLSIKHLFDTAFALALPIARERDKEAQDALDNGDDSHSRIYRQVPQLVYREGAVREHGEGVHDGPQDAPGVPRDALDPDGGLRELRPDLAERDAGAGGTQDDGPTAD